MPILIMLWLISQKPQEKPINIVHKATKLESPMIYKGIQEEDKITTIWISK